MAVAGVRRSCVSVLVMTLTLMMMLLVMTLVTILTTVNVDDGAVDDDADDDVNVDDGAVDDDADDDVPHDGVDDVGDGCGDDGERKMMM